jgi:predicted oxidoreductase (fatty acid repression mutant protein)
MRFSTLAMVAALVAATIVGCSKDDEHKQDYNPLIDDAVNRQWSINNRWRLIAQMPFGTPLDKPEAHPQTFPIGYRMILHEDNKK